MADEVTPLIILTAIKGLIQAVSNTGLVLIDESFVENEEQFYDLFVGRQNNTEAHGVLISYVAFTQTEESAFAVQVKHKIAIEFLLPFKALPDGESKNSHRRFEEEVTAVRRLLNLPQNRSLSLGGRVRHELLQSSVDWAVKRWGGGSAAKKLTHYAPTELYVNVLEKTC